jgi:serine/threonine protein kinase
MQMYLKVQQIHNEERHLRVVDVWDNPCSNGRDVILYVSILQDGIYTLPSHLSSQARDLITRILKADPLNRITVPEIRCHPWFHQHLPRYLAVDIPQYVQQLKCVCASSDWLLFLQAFSLSLYILEAMMVFLVYLHRCKYEFSVLYRHTVFRNFGISALVVLDSNWSLIMLHHVFIADRVPAGRRRCCF